MRQIILDTETTGIRAEDGHRVIEIGCLEMISRRLTGKEFHVYLNPEREVEAGALAVHGITNEFLNDKPLFRDVVDDFMAFLNGDELIIHNAPFDLSFLNHELKLTKRSWQPVSDYCRVIDTLQMARQLHVGQRNSLDALCKRYHVDLSKREFHGALLDAYLLAQVYLAMTGGQGSLFDEADHQHLSIAQEDDSEFSQGEALTYRLKVQNATPEELQEHDNYMELLKKKGKCIWS